MNKRTKILTFFSSFLIFGIGVVSSFLVINFDTSHKPSMFFLNNKKNDDTNTTTTSNIESYWNTTYYLIYPTNDASTYNLVNNVPDSGNFYTFDTKILLDLSNSIVLQINDNVDQIDQQTFTKNFTGDNLTTINNLFENSINNVLSSNSFSTTPEMQGFKISNFNLNPSITIAYGDKAGYITTSSLSYNVSGYYDDLNNEKEKNNELNNTNKQNLEKINTLNNTQIALIVIMVLLIVVIAILIFVMIRSKKRMKE